MRLIKVKIVDDNTLENNVEVHLNFDLVVGIGPSMRNSHAVLIICDGSHLEIEDTIDEILARIHLQ